MNNIQHTDTWKRKDRRFLSLLKKDNSLPEGEIKARFRMRDRGSKRTLGRGNQPSNKNCDRLNTRLQNSTAVTVRGSTRTRHARKVKYDVETAWNQLQVIN
ncbi:hypothetical protein CEXT_235551 [Caerostris extrusa]|uniref:Thoeris protein ThsB TIR-like domain-containing protein n=1 Tax=Caerostris extrusa TaxID=172846 RepID=A0AAV4UJS8_CAEEX|nr:hypothetical protein CEXT_235551 [Caerostris extrusa]